MEKLKVDLSHRSLNNVRCSFFVAGCFSQDPGEVIDTTDNLEINDGLDSVCWAWIQRKLFLNKYGW